MSNRVCPKCGEEYSETYRTCPFCEEEEALKKGKPLHRGGRRLDKSQRSGGAGGVLLLLAVVIVLGVLAYIFFGDRIADFMGIRTEEPPISDDQGSGDVPPADGGDGGATTPDDGGDGTEEPPVEAGPLTLESPATFTIAAGETGRLVVTGGSGEIAWASSNPGVAEVEDGAVTGVAAGKATITATSGEESVSCTVTVTGSASGGGSSDGGSSGSDDGANGGLRLNRTDFTLAPGEIPWQMEVIGEYDSVTWSIGNTSVATVSDTGKVTRVGPGTTTLTAVVDGKTLTCIVRCK